MKKEKKKMRSITFNVSEEIFEILAARARANMGSIAREIRVLIAQSILKESEGQRLAK